MPSKAVRRPEWIEFIASVAGGYVVCGCGRILETIEETREHWQSGHFDY